MAHMPDIEAEAKAAAGWFEHHLPHHHAAPRPPATAPATMKAATAAAPQQEDTMSLATLDDDVKADFTQGLDWLDGFVTRVKAAAPGIIATSEAVGGSTVASLVEAVAGRILPPELESILANQVKDFVDRYAPVAVTAAPAAQPPAPAQ